MTATTDQTAAHVSLRHRARASARSAGTTSAATRSPAAARGNHEAVGVGRRRRAAKQRAHLHRARSRSGRRRYPGGVADPSTRPSTCSTTIVARRAGCGRSDSRTGSMRTRRGPRAPGTTKKRRWPVAPILGQLGDAAGPRERLAVGAGGVHGEAGAPGFVVRQGRVDGVEQPPLGGGIARAARIASRSAATRAAIVPSVAALASKRWRSSASTRATASASDAPKRDPFERPASSRRPAARRARPARATRQIIDTMETAYNQ